MSASESLRTGVYGVFRRFCKMSLVPVPTHVGKPQTQQDWERIHARLQELSKKRAQLEREMAQLLLEAVRVGVPEQMGEGGIVEYANRYLGLSPRQTYERLRVAKALQQLPVLDGAMEQGELCWSAARELTRVATSESESDWLAAAEGKAVHQIETMVRGREPGDSPGDPAKPELERHVLKLELSGEAMALWRDAVAMLQRQAGGGIDEEQALLLMARQVLGGPKEEGRANYQVSISVCERCEQSYQLGRGRELPVSDDVVEMARCDAQDLGRVGDTHVGTAKRVSQTVPPATKRAVMERHHRRCAVDGCRNATFLDVHHTTPRAEAIDHDPDKLIVLCGAHHRATHRGSLIIEGDASGGFRFFHADGSRYGARTVSTDEQRNATLAFQGLRRMGVRETQARRAVKLARAAVAAEPGGAAGDIQALMRAAVQALTTAG
ncbi:HNH endonuclease [Desulfobulbus sp. AH-315-M07]|nr:HNH endonuclease [Desulfobulbus sp. AH-315-M07]